MTPLFTTLRRLSAAGCTLLACFQTLPAAADGMVPDTSVVIVHEEAGETSVAVTNTDPDLALLHVTLEDIPQDIEPLLFVTPPLTRVEPGKSQLLRFILQTKQPLTTQRLKRVVFEGIPANRKPAKAGHARVGVTVRQNLPVILHPKGLATNRTPWTDLKWSLQGEQLWVHNDTPYVVRLAQELQLLPGDNRALLPRAYVLPGENIPIQANAAGATTVRFQPATVYGFAVSAYDAPLTPARP